MRKRDLPFGSQFSATQVNLPEILDIIFAHPGDREAVTNAILERYFSKRETAWRWKLADNTFLSVRDYGLVSEDSAPTEVAEVLLRIKDNPNNLYEAFARHILINLNGLQFVNVVRDMQSSGEKITLPSLRARASQYGATFPRGATHASSLKSWLALAGIFVEGREFTLNERRLEEVLGTNVRTIDSLGELTQQQRAFLKALANLSPKEPVPQNQVVSYASTLYGVEFNEKSIPGQVLTPLENLGFITVSKGSAGRGAKPHLVLPTGRLRSEMVTPLVNALAASIGPVARQVARMRLADILSQIQSDDRHIKGRALEALAIYFLRLLDLRFVGWRLRAVEGQGAEVDVVMEGARFLFSRWQVQCKNTARVALDDVAKEVGLARRYRTNVIMVVTTGKFSRDAERYADEEMAATHLNIILLDGISLAQIKANPFSITDILNDRAERAMGIKRIDL